MSDPADDYHVLLNSSAAKEYFALPRHVQAKVAAAIDSLKARPRARGTIKLHGHASLYRIRVGDYRVIYDIDDSVRKVLVTTIRHRRDAYR